MGPAFAIRRLLWQARFASALGCVLLAAAGSAMTAELQPSVDDRLPHFRPAPLPLPKGASYQTADGAIRIVGYNDMHGILVRINSLFQRVHPEFKFELILKGTRTAPDALARGTSLLAPMGAEFSDAELADYAKLTGTAPTMFRVAHDSLNPAALSAPLAIFVDQHNPLSRISMEQVARVFAAARESDGIATWGQLGLGGEWAFRPIHLCGLAPSTALGRFMQRRLGGRQFADGFAGFSQSQEAVACVAADHRAIGFAAMNRGVSGVKVVPLSERDGDEPSAGTREDIISNRYPLDRYLLIYLRADSQRRIDPAAREYLRLVLSYEGQREIADETLGYLPLNARECAEELRRLSALD
jgi:phosphate transport system substrate-binding protein